MMSADTTRSRKSTLTRRVVLLLGILCLVATLLPTTLRADAALDEYNLSVGLYKQRRWSLAADSFGKFVKAYPKNAKIPLARLYQGLALVNGDKRAEARTVLRGFVKDYPKSRNLPDAMYRVGECSFFLDDLKVAETELVAFAKKYPKHELNEYALPYLADAQLRLKKPTGAVVSFQQAIRNYPSGRLIEDAKFGLAQAYEALKKNDEAIKLYQQLASNTAGSRAPQAQLSLATRYFDDRNFSKAEAAYQQLATRFPTSELVPTAVLNRGYALYQLGDFKKAVAQFEQAAKHKTQSVTANYWKGVSLKSLKDYKTAATVLKEVFQAKEDGPLAEEALFQSADCQLRRGEFDAAEKLFLDVVKRWPKGDSADDSLHFAAESALLAKRIENAQTLADRFGREYPDSPLKMHHELLRGRILTAAGGDENYKKAVKHFETVIRDSQVARTKLLARFHLAGTLQKLGDDEQTAKAIGPLIEQVKREGSDSEFIDALVLYSSSLLAIGKYAAASESSATYLKLKPSGDQTDQALSTKAIADAHRSEQSQSQLALDKLISDGPAKPLTSQTLHEVAEIAYDGKNYTWSESLFEKLAKLDKDSPYHAKALSGLAWSQFEQKKYRDSATTFARVVAEHSDDTALAPEAAFKRGEALSLAEAAEESAAAFSAAFKKFAPQKPAAAGDETKGTGLYAFRSGIYAARTLRSLKKTKDADTAYEQLLERFPKAKSLDKLLDEWALLNYEAKNYKRADEIFKRLVRETPQSDLADNARLSLAESAYLDGKLEEAKKEFLSLKSNARSDEDVKEVSLNHLIGIGVEQRQWKEIQTAAEELLKTFPKTRFRRRAEFHLAESRLNLNNIDGARELLLPLKEIEPGSADANSTWFPRVWVLLAEVQFRQKRYDKVIATVEEFRQKNPKSPLLYQAEEVLGRSLKNQAKFKEARTVFQRVVDHPAGRKTETAAKCQFLLAETFLIQKNYKAAQLAYLKVYYLYDFPDWQAPALYQAALCDEALDQWKNAVRTYEDLIKEFGKSEYASKAKQRLPVARKKSSG